MCPVRETGAGWGSLDRRWFQVLVVFLDVRAYDVAPGVGAKSVNVFMLGDVDGLQQGLAEIG
jgi:hypothetical protein